MVVRSPTSRNWFPVRVCTARDRKRFVRFSKPFPAPPAVGPGGTQGRAFPGKRVKGVAKTCQWGVAVQGKCPFKWPAEMSLGYAVMVSDDDGVVPAQGRRVGGPSASRYFLTVALWIPNSRSIARSDIPLRRAF